jgi:hypothetical protein
MDPAVIRSAVGGLETLLRTAKGALWQVEREVFGDPGYGDNEGGTYEYPRYAMADYLEQLHDSLLVVLEAAAMPQARADLVAAWQRFKKNKDGLRCTNDDEELQISESPAYTYVERLVRSLRMTISEEITSEQSWTLARLEAILNDAPGLVHRRQKALVTEMDLQEVMHDYLSVCFPDFRKNPPIGGTLKNFVPDCGIASVGAAIEFKLAHTKQQAITSFTGVVEDTGGYKGSKDWIRFYAVMYQAKPFVLKSHLQSDMKRIKAATWKAILANGDMKPKLKAKRRKKKS